MQIAVPISKTKLREAAEIREGERDRRKKTRLNAAG